MTLMASLKPPLFRVFAALVRLSVRCGYNGMEAPRTKWLYDRVYDALRPHGLAELAFRGRPFSVDAEARGLAPKLLLLGEYEPHLTKVFERLVTPGMTVLDVGANIGYYTAMAAERVGPDGRVVAFEPDPQNYELLARNAASMCSARVEVHDWALSDHGGAATLFRDYRSSSRSTLVREVVRKPGGELEVRLRTLDAWFAGDGGRVDLIKIDTEGSEGRIIRGGLQLIERCRPILVMEFWPLALRANGTDPDELVESLDALDYWFFVVTRASDVQATPPGRLVEMAVSRLPSGNGHLELLLLPEGRELP
jgi:FkbM family methyltransferase